MDENDEKEEISLYFDKEEADDMTERTMSYSEDSKIGSPFPISANGSLMENPKVILNADHPLMIKYQNDLKERLIKLLQEADEQLIDLNRTIKAQEKENDHFAKQGFEFQQDLQQHEEKLSKMCCKHEEQVETNKALQEKCKNIKQNFCEVEEKWKEETKKDLEYQKKLEDTAFQVVQLTSLQDETLTDAKSLKRAVEKTSKDRENLELQKLRQDLLISRLENDKYKLEDKIILYKTQWAIKKEEIADLRKELNAAHTEMEIINFERQQIVHQWKQSLASLERQDQVLSEIRNSVRIFDDDMQTLKMEITAYKKSVRKEFERNEMLTIQRQHRESDIARTEKELKDTAEKENELLENLAVIEKVIEITEGELKYLNDNRILLEKELEAKEREIQKCSSMQKSVEEKHMDILHQKLTVTKASKYTEKIIKEIRSSIDMFEDKGSKQESEKGKLLLQVDNLKTYLSSLEASLSDLQEESKKRGLLLDKSEEKVLKTREKMDFKRNECKTHEDKLKELIDKAGGQELAPFERELANLRKEIYVAEQGKRDMEQEYLHSQRELFSLSKQSSVRSEENDMYKKKVVIMDGKKLQLEADIAREEKDIKDTQNRILYVEKELAQINKMLNERKEFQECLEQAAELSKNDFTQTLKEAELNYLQKQAELNYLRKKKRNLFSKVMELQKYIVFWEQKIYLAEETRRILKSDSHLNELYELKSEIRCLQVKQEHIKKEQETLIQEMGRAVYRHTSLYIEADKQALFGKRRKTPEWVKKRIKNNKKKLFQDKKTLENCSNQIESTKAIEYQLQDALERENSLACEMMNRINSVECNTDCKHQEKRQAVLKLSFKQKKNKYLQKVKDGNYVRALRNDDQRLEEIMKIQNSLRAVQVIIQAATNEYPNLKKDLCKVLDYVIVSKEI